MRGRFVVVLERAGGLEGKQEELGKEVEKSF
jgi:hypothetical protein